MRVSKTTVRVDIDVTTREQKMQQMSKKHIKESEGEMKGSFIKSTNLRSHFFLIL